MSDQVVIIILRTNGETQVEVRKSAHLATLEGTSSTIEPLPKANARTREWLDASATWVGGVIKSIFG